MPAPTFAKTAYGWDARQYIQFGGLPIPIGVNWGGNLSYIDLNDGVSWFIEEKPKFGDAHSVTHVQQPFRNRAVYMGEDYGGRTVTLPYIYEEAVQPLGSAVAKMLGAGEQLLTFDGSTALVVRLLEYRPVEPVRNLIAPISWSGELQFFARDPFYRDIALSGTGPIATSTAGTYTITVPYLGDTISEPEFIIRIPSAWAGTINQITLQQVSSGHSLVFTPAQSLPGTGAHTFHIDTSISKVWQDVITQEFDWGGTFPAFYPVGTNTLSYNLNVSTPPTGWTIEANWYNKWVGV
jgi:hypothetical protein